jgi:hypothetical protein
MRKDKRQRLNHFANLIAATIKAGDPLYVKVFEGASWAALAQAAWCQKLGISDRTLRDLAKCSPIVSTKTINHAEKPLVLYRLGSTPHRSARHVANIMASAFRKRYGVERISRHDWGCLYGLAGVWPDGVQVEIFRMLLADLKAFMAAVKAVDPDCPHSIRYYEYLTIPLARKYPDVALELYIAAVQEAGQEPHPSIDALYPNLWPKQGLVG